MIQKQFHPSSTWNHHFAFTSTWKNKCRHYKPDGLWIKCNFDFFLFEMMVEHKLRNNIAIIIITNACILIPCSTIFFLDVSDNEFSKHHIIYSPLPDCRFGTRVWARILLQVYVPFSTKHVYGHAIFLSQ